MKSASATSAFPAPRVEPNLRHAFGGIWRLTLGRYLVPTRWLMVIGLCAFLVLTSIPFAPNPAAARMGFLPWVIIYLTRIAPLMAFVVAGGAMRDEMKAGNVDYVFTRPVPRPAFLGFKFLAQLFCIQLDFLVAFATISGIALYRHVPDWWSAVPMLLGAQVLVVTAFSAFGFLCGILTSRYIVIGLAYGMIIEFGIGTIPTQINKIAMTHQIQAMLHQYLPTGTDFMPMVPAASFIIPSGVGATAVALLGFTAVMLFLAGAIFTFMELSGPNEG
jgi:ABC-type transport system involved in multi-copper enzyme maturation permease subunit